jgi:hypothetical protein
MPTTPPVKHAIKIQAASFGEYPAASNDFFDEGNILYNAENNY